MTTTEYSEAQEDTGTGVAVIDAIIASATGQCQWGRLRFNDVPTGEDCAREDARLLRIENGDGTTVWLSLCAGHDAALIAADEAARP
jgi:hypothetical protein